MMNDELKTGCLSSIIHHSAFIIHHFMKLVFMGTPESAVPTLRRCVEDGHEVVAVWTQPDRPAGRGNRLKAPPVKEYAFSRGLNIHQPSKIKTEGALSLFESHAADAAVVVAYGRILPPSFLRAPRRGCVNVHFSLLPKYRGAAPVNWAIVRGEAETGVTTMQIDEGLDTGALLLQRATRIGAAETAPELLARLASVGADLLGDTLARLDDIAPRPQRDAGWARGLARAASRVRRPDARRRGERVRVRVARARERIFTRRGSRLVLRVGAGRAALAVVARPFDRALRGAHRLGVGRAR